MKRLILGLMAAFITLFAIDYSASAQTGKDLVGTWNLVSAITDKDGTKSEIFGSDAKGSLIFDANGRYMIAFVAASLPKFAANNRAAGTPEENKAVISGSLAHFGAYTVDEAGKSFTFHIEGCTYANWTGTLQQRAFTVAGDRLEFTDPNASAGGRSTVSWRRAKQ
jgi:hypothetical protein